ncbi:beta-galactosidase [Asticcacaulis sp. W401b]|uniref:beta-galactosidase n=1 Tax=Asticcacaulis sp. W401b TaxID=3388666 RepID=UPI003970F6B8
MKKQILKVMVSAGVLLAVMGGAARAQTASQPLQIDLSGAQPTYKGDHLKSGGTNAAGHSYTVNQSYISVDGKPVIKITGEFHYYRYPHQYWEEELLKMKAGGIDTVATYAHWIVHEEEEGKWDWSGDRDLRAFIELCQKLDVKVLLRVGPYGHGEVRSGGFPDWLLAKPLTVRANDPVYLNYVGILYKNIADQVKGLWFKDGGPIVGLQIENEYQHSASPWALNYPGQPLDYTVAPEDKGVTHHQVSSSATVNTRAAVGVEHMRSLKKLAEDAGMDAPLWTATGWGNATIVPNETLPVQAAYAYPSWDAKARPSSLYLYTDLQKNPDYAPLSYNATEYPYLAAELGPGMINHYARRPYIPLESADALVNRFLGSGSNGIGYYMFQSGTTPHGKRSFLSDEPVGYPKMSYDFGGPLGEFGDVRPTFNRLKVQHFFMKDFGDRLAPSPVALPANAASIDRLDTKTLRYAARGANGSGFLFINNFQDHVTNVAKDARFEVKTPNGTVALPLKGEMHIPAGENLILPVNLDLSGVNLVSATVQPMAHLSNKGGEHYVFFGHEGIASQFVFPGNTVVKASSSNGCTVRAVESLKLVECKSADVARFEVETGGKKTNVLLLDHASAMNAWVLGENNDRHLFISEATPLYENGQIAFRSVGKNVAQVRVYPAPAKGPELVGVGAVKSLVAKRGFATYQLTQKAYEPAVDVKWPAYNKVTVALPKKDLPPGVVDVWMDLPYEADTAQAFVGNDLVADHFYAGEAWRIGTKRFLGKSDYMLFNFRPLLPDMPFYVDLPNPPQVKAGEQIIRVGKVTMTPEYETTIRFPDSTN